MRITIKNSYREFNHPTDPEKKLAVVFFPGWPYEVPDWVKETDAFKQGIADGSLIELKEAA